MRGIPVTIYLENDIWQKVKEEVERRQDSISTFVQKALDFYLKELIRRKKAQELLNELEQREIDSSLLEEWKRYEDKERGLITRKLEDI